MNQLLTEMDGMNPTKQIFFIGATNRPDILDPAIKRPGRLDQMIFIDLPDFPGRVSILKACLRKSPMAPDVDFEYLAEQTHGYSGADLHGIAKVSAKLAIRRTIAKQVQKLKDKEAKMKLAEEAGTELVPDEEDNVDEDEVPMITMEMMTAALKESKRSVAPSEYQKYLEMKVQFDREAGIIDGPSQQQRAPVSGIADSASRSMPSNAPTAQPSLQDDEDDDDIYS